MSSNNAVVKNNKSDKSFFTTIIVGVAIVVVLFFLYSTFVGYRDYLKYSPYFINGITDASVSKKIPSYQVKPSSNTQYGTEFTYSFWAFIKDTNFSSTNTSSCSTSTQDTSLLHIFHKGSYDYIPSGGSTTTVSKPTVYYPLLQMPGVWLYPNTNKLNIRFNTYENVVESADVGNIPLNMWVNIIIILIGGSVDVYINGNLKKRTKLVGVPKINYGDFYVTNWGGFQGYLCRLRYFNYAIQPFTVDQIYEMGPAQQFESSTTGGLPVARLSPNFWFNTGYPNSAFAPGVNQNNHTTA
jgi:hypothetical protein